MQQAKFARLDHEAMDSSNPGAMIQVTQSITIFDSQIWCRRLKSEDYAINLFICAWVSVNQKESISRNKYERTTELPVFSTYLIQPLILIQIKFETTEIDSWETTAKLSTNLERKKKTGRPTT